MPMSTTCQNADRASHVSRATWPRPALGADGELFKLMAGVDLVHVPYRGSYWADLLSGQVQVAFAPIPSWAHPSGYAARPRLRPPSSIGARGSC